MLKKCLSLCICLLLLSCKPAIAELPVLKGQAVFTVDSNTVIVDGKKFTIDAAPFINKDRLFVPVKVLGETLGAEITWENNEATLTWPAKNIILNNEYELKNVTPVIIPPDKYLPARYIYEAAGYKVNWDPDTRAIIIFRG